MKKVRFELRNWRIFADAICLALVIWRCFRLQLDLRKIRDSNWFIMRICDRCGCNLKWISQRCLQKTNSHDQNMPYRMIFFINFITSPKLGPWHNGKKHFSIKMKSSRKNHEKRVFLPVTIKFFSSIPILYFSVFVVSPKNQIFSRFIFVSVHNAMEHAASWCYILHQFQPIFFSECVRHF